MDKRRNKKSLEQSVKPKANAFLFILFVTGVLSSWIEPLWQLFAQWNQLAHLILGIVSIPAIFLYLWRHFVNTLGARKPLLLATGLLTLLPFLYLVVSGIWVLMVGETEQLRWVTRGHQYAAYLLFLAITAHLLLYLPTARKQPAKTKTQFPIAAILTLVCIILLAAVHQTSDSRQPLVIDIPESYSLSYGENPFAPSQNTTAEQKFVATHAIADSQECGACHRDIYQQWSSSIHSQSASDPTYVANINLLEQSKGIEATRYCEGCHAPVAIMTGALTPGGMHGGNPESVAHLEGVGCTGCHRITDIEHTQGTASYRFEPAESEFIANTPGFLQRTLNNLVLKTNSQAHVREMTPAALYIAELCATCHEQFMDESMNDWGYVTMQHLYSDWLESPFSGQSEQEFTVSQQMNCQSCHMPLVAANDPSADANGMVRSHRFPGANTAIPWINSDTEQLETVQRFMQASRITVQAEPVPRGDSPENQNSVKDQLLPTHLEQQPYFLYLNETAEIRVSVTNRLVGHSFPAGTTDLNQVWIDFSVRDATNRLIYQSGAIDSEGYVDPNAYFYKSVPVDRRGNEVWRHDLFNMVGDAYSNLIQSGETDIKNYSFQVPSWAKGPLSIDTRIKYRKFNKQYSDWALSEINGLPITDIAQDQITVPLYERSPVSNL